MELEVKIAVILKGWESNSGKEHRQRPMGVRNLGVLDLGAFYKDRFNL